MGDGTKIAEDLQKDHAQILRMLAEDVTLPWFRNEKQLELIERLSAAEERERVLREALEDIATFGLSKRDREVARAALATPAPEQPSAEKAGE